MSWRILAEVRDRQLPSAHAKLLMLLLAEWVNNEGVAIYTRSKAEFADVCQISARQVQRIFADLIKRGLVEIEIEAKAATKQPRTYRINITELRKLPLTATARSDLARERRRNAIDGNASPAADFGVGRGDYESPAGETDRRGRGDCESRRGDRLSPIVTPMTPKETQEAPPPGVPPQGAPGGSRHAGRDDGQEELGLDHSSAIDRQGGRAPDASRGTRLPPGWQPDQPGLAFAAGQGMTDEEIDRESEKFADYWRGRAGQQGRKADWAATWRNWIRRAVDDRRDGGGVAGRRSGGNRSTGGGFVDAIARAAGLDPDWHPHGRR